MSRNLTFLPFFPGFYETVFTSEFDAVEGELIEELQEEHPSIEFDWFTTTTTSGFGDYRRAVATAYCELISGLLSEFIGTTVNIEFKSIESPRYYNFTTDRVEGWIPESDVLALFAATNKDILRRHIKERFTDRDGFVSFYSNDLNVWLKTRVLDWDINQLETLLMAAVETHTGTEFGYEEVLDLFDEACISLYGLAIQHCEVKLKDKEQAA